MTIKTLIILLPRINGCKGSDDVKSLQIFGTIVATLVMREQAQNMNAVTQLATIVVYTALCTQESSID